MKIEKIDLSQERLIITYMIVSTPFLEGVSKLAKTSLFESKYARFLSEWVLEYWERYKQAPGKNIQDVYHQKVKKVRNDDVKELISVFLVRLSKEYQQTSETTNVSFLLTTALRFFRVQSLKEAKERLESAIVEDDPEKGEHVIATYSRIEEKRGNGVFLLNDAKAIVKALAQEDEVLLRLPGFLGEVVGPLSRSDFVAFMAPFKRGKSWWSWYVAQVGVFYGLKCACFNFEISERKYNRRGWVSMMGQPMKDKEVMIPFFESVGNNEFCVSIEYKKMEGLKKSIKDIEKEQKKLRMQFRSGNVFLSTSASASKKVEDIEKELDNLAYYDHYIPDMIVVDSPDLMLFDKRIREPRLQIDEVWKGLRRISTERNLLIVAPTHTNKKTLDRDVKEGDSTEDMMKMAHVTKSLGINLNDTDRAMSAVRISHIVDREEKKMMKQALVLQCIDLGLVHIDSKDVNTVVGLKE
ncbi:MAG: hypothetical protein WC516_06785 [Patescibacteria group bacterium]